MSPAEYQEIRENLEKDRGEIQKIVNSSVREDGKAEFLEHAPYGPHKADV